MKRWAHILDSRILEIIEADTKPDWPPYTDGRIPYFEEVDEHITTNHYKDKDGTFKREEDKRVNKNLLTIYVINDCNRRCSYCPCGEWNATDPNEDLEQARAWGYPNPGSPNQLTVDGLMKWINKHIHPFDWRIEITGGEPGMFKDIDELLYQLDNDGYQGIIRTNGDFEIKKVPNFTIVTAWHDDPDTPPKYIGDVILFFEHNKDKIKYCEEHGIKYKVIHDKNGEHIIEEEAKAYFNGWAYIYSCGQLSAGNGCSESSYKSGPNNIWNDSPPLIKEKPCIGCNSVIGYEYVKSIE